MQTYGRKWWKEGIVYQIYPRSFKDSNGDGIGDLRGIISKLDYIESLGIDMIWLNPVYQSPNADNGYDISDYFSIMDDFGTMDDFDTLLQGLHDRNIRLVMDLVVNHTSDEHPWFIESRSSRTNPYRDFYHWWPAEKGKPPYRWSFFDPKAKAWQYDEPTDAYYLHYFAKKQPDLNWENPKTREAVYDMMEWWFQKGIDGFRMDVIPFISKDPQWPMITEADLKAWFGSASWPRYYAQGPKLHTYLKEMRQKVLNKYDVVALGEGAGISIDQALDFVDENRGELDLFFHFEGQDLGLSPNGFKQLDKNGWALKDFKKVYAKWSDVFAKKGWGSIYLGNHDQPRMVSRWGNDSEHFRSLSAKMLHTFLLTMRATPFIYQGDEIGMTNLRLSDINDYRDIETLGFYDFLTAKGVDINLYLEDWKTTARDNGRSPFQWDNSPQAGFTTGKPWLKINDNHKFINVKAQESDPASILNYFRELVRLRKNHPVWVYGDFQLVAPEHEQLFAYTRQLDKTRMLVVLNFSDREARLEAGWAGEVMINNYPDVTVQKEYIELKPWQSVVISLR
jgi:oligo-1,6-glucosidase